MSYSECHFRLKWFLIDSKINFIFTSKKILEKFVIILVCLSDLPIHQYWSRHNEFQYFRVNNDFVFHIVCCPLAFIITSRKYKVNIMWPDRSVRGKGLVNNLQTDIGGEGGGLDPVILSVNNIIQRQKCGSKLSEISWLKEEKLIGRASCIKKVFKTFSKISMGFI